MDGSGGDVLSRYQVRRHRITVALYHGLIGLGLAGEDDRIELLEGQLVAMPPVAPRHAIAVNMINRMFSRAVGDDVLVRVQDPVTLDGFSEPEPDIVLARAPWPGYPNCHPGPEDILLLVEAADTTRAFDLGAKREIYGRAGIREFWVVDLVQDCVVVLRRPVDGTYTSERIVPPGGSLAVEALPGLAIPAAPLFT